MYWKELSCSFENYRSSSRRFVQGQEISNKKCRIFQSCKNMNMEYLGPFSWWYITLLLINFYCSTCQRAKEFWSNILKAFRRLISHCAMCAIVHLHNINCIYDLTSWRLHDIWNILACNCWNITKNTHF